ncbi:MAG: hypothetical protein IJ999_02805 [Clostridia bacterium]|nr:hypothetical protein [Clostridia bacterium]
METKKFVKNVLLRSIPFFVFVIATIVLKVAEVMPAEWWGWIALYLLDVASLAFPIIYAAKNSRGIIVENVRKNILKKVAKQYLAQWGTPEYNTENIIGYIYQNEHNFDRTILFANDDMTIEQVVRDDEGMVTGEKTKEVVTYDKIESLAVVDIGTEGSAHIELTLDNGNKEYVYFDLDVAKFFVAKTGKPIANMDELKSFYISVAEVIETK